MSNHKIITLYDAETKKNKSLIFNTKNFASQVEIDAHVSKLKNEQKMRNKMYREMNKKGIIFNPIEKPLITFNNIQIKNTFDLKLDNGTGNTTTIYGSGKRGKTSLCMYIYKKYYAVDKEFISSLFSINSHIPEYKVDKNLLKSNCFNSKSEKYIKLEKYIQQHTKNKYKFLNILDDIITVKFNKLINELILTYRNSNMSTIINTQYVFLLNKMLRANVNNVIIFGFNSTESIEDVIKTFLKPYFINLGYKKMHEQIELFKYVTDNHGFIYLHPISDTISFHRLNKI